MDIIEIYLRAVAAQLPADQREDITAELRDEVMTRIEVREAELGRPLTEAEVETVLRELGHPLVVAARFGAGPQHVVGPELYPWWLFGVKAALFVLVAITIISALVRILIGDVDAGQAIGQAFAGAFSGAISIVGFATLAGFIIERQAQKPDFLTQWKVRELAVFELGRFSADWGQRASKAAAGDWSGEAKMSPPARAMASAAAWGVFALWWAGLLPGTIAPGSLGGGAVIDGVDYGLIVNQLVALLYWPVLAFAGLRAGFHLLRAVTGSPARFTALGDLAFSLVSLGFIAWLWLASPLAPVIAVDTVADFTDRVGDMIQFGDFRLATLLMIGVVFSFIAEIFTALGALVRLVRGR